MKTFVVSLFMACVAAIWTVGSMPGGPNEPASNFLLTNQESNPTATELALLNDVEHQTRSDTTIADSVQFGSKLSREEVEKLIELHNKARAEVNVRPLKWSNELAAYAQEWADHLASTSCKMAHRPRSGKWQQKHGENIFSGSAGFYGVEDAAKFWEGEKALYEGDALNSSNWYRSGHYTQIVWSNTEYVGCAKVECDGAVIVVCNYDPPGNMLGQKPY